MGLGVAGGGLSLAAAVLIVYWWAMRAGTGPAAARSAAFATWLIGHIVLALHMRSLREPLVHRGLRVTAPFALWAAAAVGLAAAGAWIPLVNRRLYLAPLSGRVWAVIVLAALLLPSWWEPVKWVRWIRQRRRNVIPSDEVGNAGSPAGPPAQV